MADENVDQVLVVRARAARVASWAKRLGYGLFAFSLVVFMVGLLSGFHNTHGQIITISVVVGSIFLAPAIITSYAVKAAIRHEREHHQESH